MKRKDITNATHHNRVNILVPFDINGTLITCGTFKEYCEVLDINDITNSIFYESNILVGPRLNEKSVAFIAGRYLLFGKKDNDADARDTSDKTRSVLIASTVIPSVKGVIWAGEFSAQNQQEPENSVLALYNISNVQDRVKWFCPLGDRPCGSKSGSELQPLSVVFKYSSISAVAAMRSESWIVLFIGTSDGQLIKLVLDEKFTPGCPTVLYKSDDE
ncbi:hypothetical protein QQF64_035466 [Cirrhinus molitorella]|uniref:Uncharacterized protein n=1 Tax=Cirrhinus molitorella TaxID=172907 RepID=A0ABR3NGL5_9TELE